MANYSTVEAIRASGGEVTIQSFMDMLGCSPKKVMTLKLTFALKFDQVRLSHHVDVNNNGDLIVTCIVGKGDHNLVRLATMKDGLGFPRGFHIIWSLTSGYLGMVAFRSKFTNDERNDKIVLPPKSQIRFTKKYSGSLCLVTAFQYCHQTYLYVGSKNSTGNEFVDIFLQNFKVTDEILHELQGRSAAFEVCSDDPRSGHHGALYMGTHPISIAIGRTDNSDDIVSFLSDDELMKLSLKLGFQIDDRYIIRDTNQAIKFMNELNMERDFITNGAFDDLIDKSDCGITVLKGNFQHSSLTDVLEGLIVFIVDKNGQSTVEKFKFPRYTVMTMVIRECIEAGYFGTDKLPEQFDLRSIQSHTNAWSSKWVICTKNRRTWLSIVTDCAKRINEYGAILNSRSYLHVCQPAMNASVRGTDLQADHEIKIKVRRCPIIAILGPVGSGKSTLARKLLASSTFGVEIVEVDDHKETVQNGGRSCNNSVVGTIAYIASQGRTPIVVNGGGIFLKLRSELRKYGVEPYYCQVMIPATLKMYLDGTNKERTKALNTIFNDITTAVDGRFDRREYQIGVGWERFTSKEEAYGLFKKVTRANLAIANKLLSDEFSGATISLFDHSTKQSIVVDPDHHEIYSLPGTFTCGIKADVTIRGVRYLGHITQFAKVPYDKVLEFMDSLPPAREGTGLVAKPNDPKYSNGLMVVVPIWEHGHISISGDYNAKLNEQFLKNKDITLKEKVHVIIGTTYMYRF